MDFAFSFPFGAKGGKFPGGITTRTEFWKAVHRRVWAADARQCVNAWRAHFLWFEQVEKTQHTGRQYVAARRAADLAAAKMGARANTPFKLVGSNQVGKASLCGIALLEALRRHCRKEHLPLTVWPFFSRAAGGGECALARTSCVDFAAMRGLVLVETYPSLYWARCRLRGRPWGDPAAWAQVKDTFGSSAPRVAPRTGDEGDALIAWYALSKSPNFAQRPSAECGLSQVAARQLAATDWRTVSQEGWIFGL